MDGNSRSIDSATGQAIVEGSPLGMHFYELDAQGRLVFSGANPAADRLLGISHGELVGKPIEEAFPPLAATEIPERYRRAALAGESWSTEQVSYADGRISGAFEVHAFRTRESAMVAVFSNITHHLQAEEELRHARFLLERAEEMAGIGSWEFDYRSRKVHGSPGAHRIYGVEGEMTVAAMEALPLPEYRPLLDKARDEHIKLGKDYDIEFRIRRGSDGAHRDLRSRALWDPEAKTFFGMIRDITEEKKAQAEILALNRDLERRVEERTAALKTANESLARALEDLAASQERQILAEKMAALGRLVASLAHELNTPLGAILSASESGERDADSFLGDLRTLHDLADEDWGVFESIARCALGRETLPDQGEERARRRGYRSELEQLGVADASLVADELVDIGYACGTAPLREAASRGSLPAISHAAYRLTAFLRSNWIIKSAGEKAARVVGALKTYSHGVPGESVRPSDLREQLETALTLHHNRIKAGIEVERRYAELPPIPCYPDRLCQVWVNLVSNAVHAMEHGGRLVIETAREGDFALVSIIDDGPGIAPEHRARIFEPFFTTKLPGEGTGLGLDICRKILGEIGGTIDFESVPGRTRFTARLSLATGDKP